MGIGFGALTLVTGAIWEALLVLDGAAELVQTRRKSGFEVSDACLLDIHEGQTNCFG